MRSVSLMETAKANGLNPYQYLEFILENLPDLPFRQYPEILDQYLPWNADIQMVCLSGENLQGYNRINR